MALARKVEAEWLDHLPAHDPRAIRSRRDLKLINVMMLQAGIMARALRSNSAEKQRTILDLGAGDGTFMLGVARRLSSYWRDVDVILVDRQNIISDATCREFRTLYFRAEPVVADVFDFLERMQGTVDIAVVNLFLHHMPHERLARLLALAARATRLFVACEPRRAAFPLLASRSLWALGCNDVTRHDVVASVRAGFNGKELSALWPDHGAWNLDEHAARLFTHRFVARRTARNAT